MGITVVTRNYQVTLPSDVRAQANIEIGEQMIVDVDSLGNVRLTRLATSPVDRAFGILKIKESGLEYERRMRAEWKGR
ncbi:AbrB/MazE/SpoVT family DNA-binding domain-containing protein [Candidatus Woesearchaeota archaeon]|nr:AbrB/MazE/SpoVT family DNA-binding domain-containing protein [Candidatus Woesearchaeota archaeon]